MSILPRSMLKYYLASDPMDFVDDVDASIIANGEVIEADSGHMSGYAVAVGKYDYYPDAKFLSEHIGNRNMAAAWGISVKRFAELKGEKP